MTVCVVVLVAVGIIATTTVSHKEYMEPVLVAFPIIVVFVDAVVVIVERCGLEQ